MRQENENRGIVGWLGFKNKPDFSKASSLGGFFGFILTLFAATMVVAALIALSNFVQALLKVGPYSLDVDGSSIRNIGLVLVALLGAPFVIWRSIVAARQVEIADESLFNDKVNAAATDLAAQKNVTEVIVNGEEKSALQTIEDDLVRRAAAIDRLEGLAFEREEVAPRIVRLLATYVRGNFPCADLEHTAPPFPRKVPRMDLQKAVDTIGRIHRPAVGFDRTHWRIDLKGCDLDGVNFQSGYFWAADMSGSRLEACIFREANFEGCLLTGSLLNFSDFFRTNFKGAKLNNAILSQSSGWVGTLGTANLYGATFIAADLSGVSHLGSAEKLSKTFGTKDTTLSSALRYKKTKANSYEMAHLNRSMKDEVELTAEEKDQIKELETTGFQNWSPYDSGDMANGQLLSKFYDELGLNKWPYL